MNDNCYQLWLIVGVMGKEQDVSFLNEFYNKRVILFIMAFMISPTVTIVTFGGVNYQ